VVHCTGHVCRGDSDKLFAHGGQGNTGCLEFACRHHAGLQHNCSMLSHALSAGLPDAPARLASRDPAPLPRGTGPGAAPPQGQQTSLKSILTGAGRRSNLHPGTALLARVPGGAGYGGAGGVLALGTGGAAVYAAASGELLHALAWAPGRPPAALTPLAPGRWLVGDDRVRRQGLAEGITATPKRGRRGHDVRRRSGVATTTWWAPECCDGGVCTCPASLPT